MARALLDFDGRLRSAYSMTTTTSGRLASRVNVFGTGMNLQNIPYEFRNCIIPSEGMCFVEADLKQAEAMIVAWYANEPRMKYEFSRPGGDIHILNATILFDKSWDEIVADKVSSVPTKSMRYIAKRMVHGMNYGLGPRTMLDILTVEFPDFSFMERELKEKREKYFSAFPLIREWHRVVEGQINATRVLVNPFGRRRMFFGRLNEDLYRKAYSFLPQSTCVDYTNHGLLRAEYRQPKSAQLVAQVHDQGLFECSLEDQDQLISILLEELSLPIVINGEPLIIPVEFKSGPEGQSWGELQEVGCGRQGIG